MTYLILIQKAKDSSSDLCAKNDKKASEELDSTQKRLHFSLSILIAIQQYHITGYQEGYSF